MDLDRFYGNENVALYRLLASSTNVDERRAILRLLADETARLKSECARTAPRLRAISPKRGTHSGTARIWRRDCFRSIISYCRYR
jgi:hypothetical protein